MKQQCMARNKPDSARCERPATKLMPTRGHLTWNPQDGIQEQDPSITTLYLCGICARRLRSGSQSLNLEIDDGNRHTAYVDTRTEQGREIVRTKQASLL